MVKNKIENKNFLTISEIAKNIEDKTENRVIDYDINQVLLRMGLIKQEGKNFKITEKGAKFGRKNKKERFLWKKDIIRDIENTYRKILADKCDEQFKEQQERVEKALDLFGEKVKPGLNVDELERVLNPDGQNYMVSLYDFYDKNDEILVPFIFNQLILNRFIEVYDDRNDKNGLIICNKPYTDIYMKPVLDVGDGYIYIENLLVISDEVEEFLQEYCDEYII